MSPKSRGKGKTVDQDERSRLIRASGLAGAVIALVLVGWFLQADPSGDPLYPTGPGPSEQGDAAEMTAAQEPTLDPAAPDEAYAAVPDEAPGVPAGVEPVRQVDPADWARRMDDDVERLGSHTGDWTLQLIVACDAANVARLLDAAGDDDALHLIPAEIGDRTCFRLCWGTYPDRDSAAADRLPAALQANLGEGPQPRQIDGLLP